MSPGLALLLSLTLVTVAASGSAFAHPGGNGYAALTIDRGSVRCSLTLWPATLLPAVGEHIQRARGGDAASRERLLGFIREVERALL